MFFIDRVNVKTFWEPSLWMVDEVTQLMSTKNLKEIVGKNELVRSRLLEEYKTLSFQLKVLMLLRLTIEVLLTKNFLTPLP